MTVLLESLRRFVALHRFPSSQRPCLSSDGISTEWVLFPLQRRPLTTVRPQGPPVGRRAGGTWTATWDYVQKTLHLGAMLLDPGRPERVRPRQEARLVGPALCRLLCNPAKEPTQAPPTRLNRSALRQHVARLPASRSTSNNTAPRTASASLGTASVLLLVFQTSLKLCPRACIMESRPSIISDEERLFAEGFPGPRTELQKEPS